MEFPIVVTKTVLDKQVEVQIDHFLKFRCPSILNEYAYCNSWEDLEQRIKQQMKINKIEHAIEVVISEERKYIRATLRGLHQTKGVLFTINGKKETIQHPTIVAMGNAVSDLQLIQLNALRTASHEASAAESAFRDTLNPKHHLSAVLLIHEANQQALAKDPA